MMRKVIPDYPITSIGMRSIELYTGGGMNTSEATKQAAVQLIRLQSLSSPPFLDQRLLGVLPQLLDGDRIRPLPTVVLILG